MLSIGEFSKICQVSAKTLRYYAEIGLLQPAQTNPENGYRFYAIEQLEKMLLINRLKSYHFSLEEIKKLLTSDEVPDESFIQALHLKKKDLEKQLRSFEKNMMQLSEDINNLESGKPIMSYLDDIDVQLVDVPMRSILYVRKMIHQQDLPKAYTKYFERLFRDIADKQLTATCPPMVLFHSDEFTPMGLDIEFAIPVKEYVTGTRDFSPGLCLKTVVSGSYANLPAVYSMQCMWAEKNGYVNTHALYEVYLNSLSQVTDESQLLTEVYYPVKFFNVH